MWDTNLLLYSVYTTQCGLVSRLIAVGSLTSLCTVHGHGRSGKELSLQVLNLGVLGKEDLLEVGYFYL